MAKTKKAPTAPLIKFIVTLGLDVTLDRTVEVEAANKGEAEEKARDIAIEEADNGTLPVSAWDSDTGMGARDAETLSVDLDDEFIACGGCDKIIPFEDSYAPGDDALCAECDTEVTGRDHTPKAKTKAKKKKKPTVMRSCCDRFKNEPHDPECPNAQRG